ncbi:hypothetical protein DF3PB_5620003 [uncultured Defluviicoccus sp.]|uniref:Uncharacterized protein n=1 Tax=metagenome TaxID=256318 RepID=A0A380TJ54_9ZZZZ|nr:hypothetical protein DF3PB_5620003 [uncultured Defluviicoccus sp.]
MEKVGMAENTVAISLIHTAFLYFR